MSDLVNASAVGVGRRVRDALNDWQANELPRWLFVVKTLLAAFLALWIAFRLGFESPRSAMLTVFIVALPSSGQALEKSVYRLIGTLVGCIAALTFMGLFPQQARLLFLALAIWAFLCTAGAARVRNAKSYGFVLAGYTACLITLPAINRPLDLFDGAVARVTEISLGILCYALINDVLFPVHRSNLLVQKVRALYFDFATMCRATLQRQLSRADLENRHLRFAADVAGLESERSAAVMEAGEIRLRSRRLHAFNVATMAALTTFHTLHQLMERMRNRIASPIPELMQPLFNRFADMMLVGDGPARTAVEAAITRDRLEGLLQNLPAMIANVRNAYAMQTRSQQADESQRLDLETAIELLERFADECRALVAIYAELPNNNPNDTEARRLPPSYSASTPPMLSLAAGLRNMLALLIIAFAWYALNWQSAINAVLMTTVFCGLAASAPAPERVIGPIMKGFIVATPLAFVCAFLVLNQSEGFIALVLGMLPFIAIGVYMIAVPGLAGIGTGFCLMFAQMVAPENVMRFDVGNFINDSMAQIFGVAIAGLMFAVILPEHRPGSRRHVHAALWHEAEIACTDTSPHLRHEFENRMRDLLSQLNAAAGGFDETKRSIVSQAMTLLEIGHALIGLRTQIQYVPRGTALASLSSVVDSLAAWFREPRAISRYAAVDAIDAAVDACTALPNAQRLQSNLHLIRTSLLDEMLGDDPHAIFKEMPHAT